MSTTPYRLTYLIDGLNVSGAQVGMARLISGLDPATFDVTVIGLNGMGKGILPQLPDNATVLDLAIDPKYRFDRLRKLWFILEKTDILVTSLFHSTTVGTALGRLQSVPLILCWQHSAEHVSRPRKILSRAAYAACDRVLVDSQAVADMLVSEGVPDDRIYIVPIAGIDINEFYPPDRTAGRGTATNETIRVGSIGQLIPAKNYETLIECAAGLDDRFEFEVIGDGPRRRELERLVDKQAPSQVTFHGQIPPDDVAPFLRELDIYFQPSRREGLCITVIEAMACALPVVGAETGGIQESVKHGRTGLLAPPEDPKTFRNHLRTLASSRRLRRQYGLAGRERIVENYSQEALVNEFHNALLPDLNVKR